MAENILWNNFCQAAAEMMRGVLEGAVPLEKASDFFEKDKSISDPDLRRYVEYIIWEIDSEPDYYKKLLDLFERKTSEKELVWYLHHKPDL